MPEVDSAVFEGRHAELRPDSGGPLVVTTWNIQFGIDIEGAVGTLAGHEVLARSDVILLQEMDEHGTATIAAELALDYAYAPASIHPRTGRNFGNAVLSRWPLADAEVIPLPHRAPLQGQPRMALRATVTVDALEVSVCSVHTETPAMTWTKRLAQFVEIGAAASGWPTDHVVVGGDFNTATRRGIRGLTEQFERHGLDHVSAGAGSTLRRGGQSFTLDHVFADGFAATGTGVVADADASDHSPVWVELEPVVSGPVGAPPPTSSRGPRR